MNEDVIDHLKKMANSRCYFDIEDEDKTVDDYAYGNVDDAFCMGELQGEVLIARTILETMNINWKRTSPDD
jgi:hypothetical protein